MPSSISASWLPRVAERVRTVLARREELFGSDQWHELLDGLEQGGGEDLAELDRRLAAWVDLGSEGFADLRDYCFRLGDLRWHRESPRIQPTLGKLVRLILASEGHDPTANAVRAYQAHQFGRLGRETVVAELMPLPCRNVSEWIYSAIVGVPALLSREQYVERYRPLRSISFEARSVRQGRALSYSLDCLKRRLGDKSPRVIFLKVRRAHSGRNRGRRAL